MYAVNPADEPIQLCKSKSYMIFCCDNNHVLPFLCLGLSIIQNGKLPTFFTEEMLQAIFSRITPLEPCLEALQNGFKEVGIYQVRVNYVNH